MPQETCCCNSIEGSFARKYIAFNVPQTLKKYINNKKVPCQLVNILVKSNEKKIYPNEVDPQVPLVPEQNENKGKDLECKNVINVFHGKGSLSSDKRQSS